MHIAIAELNESVLIQLVVLRVEKRVVFSIEANGKKSEVYNSGLVVPHPDVRNVRILNGYLGHGVNILKWTLDNDPKNENDGEPWHLAFKVVARRLLNNREHDEVELETWEKSGRGGSTNVWTDSLTILY